MSEKTPPIPDRLLQFARHMRTFSTDAEKRLWSVLRDRRLGGFKFRRQVPIGNYIIDFYCHEGTLAVEADGGQHSEPFRVGYDVRRTNFLRNQGIRVIRFWDHHVLRDTQVVKEMIYRALTEGTSTVIRPHPGPLPEGEGVGGGAVGSSTVIRPHPNPLPEGEGARGGSVWGRGLE